MNQKSVLKTIRVSQFGKIVTGNTPPRKIKDYFGDKITWIKPTDIQLGSRFIGKTEEKFSEKAYDKYIDSIIPPLSTCVVTIGTIGKKICLTKDYSFTNQAINAIIPNQSEYDPLFVFYVMKYNLFQLQSRHSGTSSGRENISKSSFGNMKLSVVDLPSQKIIGEIISKYDDLIENYSNQIKLLDDIITLIFSEWFLHLKFPGYDLNKFGNSELGKLPQDWTVGTLKNLGYIQPGYAFKSKNFQEHGYRVMKIRNIDNLKINVNVGDCVSEEIFHKIDPKFHVISGDVLIAMTGAKLGKVGITPKTLSPFLLNQRVGKVVSNHSCLFYCFLRTEYIQETMDGISNASSAQGNISDSDIENILIKLPNSDLIEKFDMMMNPLFKQIVNHLQKINILKSIRDYLTPQLMSGEIHVLNLGIQIHV